MAQRGRTEPDREPTRNWLVFEWWLPSDGYEWTDGHQPGSGEKGPWLIARGETGGWYRPLHDHRRGAMLFWHLADVSDRHTALAFANRYGALGVFEGIVRGPGSTGRGIRGEPLSSWVREAAHLRAGVQLADAARSKDLARLRQWIRVHKGRGAVFSHPDLDLDLGPALERDATFKLLGPKLPGMGLLFAQRLINMKLEKDAVQRVLADTTAPGDLVLGTTLRHLLAAAWVQLARWLTGETAIEYRLCLACKERFPVGPGNIGRDDKEYCGDNNCRQRRKRARRKAREET